MVHAVWEGGNGMNHDALTDLRYLNAEKCDRVLAHTYDLRMHDGFAAAEGGGVGRMRSLIASAIRSHTRMMERIARTLEHAHHARPGKHTLPALERNVS